MAMLVSACFIHASTKNTHPEEPHPREPTGTNHSKDVSAEGKSAETGPAKVLSLINARIGMDVFDLSMDRFMKTEEFVKVRSSHVCILQMCGCKCVRVKVFSLVRECK